MKSFDDYVTLFLETNLGSEMRDSLYNMFVLNEAKIVDILNRCHDLQDRIGSLQNKMGGSKNGNI